MKLVIGYIVRNAADVSPSEVRFRISAEVVVKQAVFDPDDYGAGKYCIPDAMRGAGNVVVCDRRDHDHVGFYGKS